MIRRTFASETGDVRLRLSIAQSSLALRSTCTDIASKKVMKTINEVSPVKAYKAGQLAAKLESVSMNTPLTESRVDEIKEDLSHYNEKRIDDSQLSDEEKEEQKRQIKQCLEVYVQGVKEEMSQRRR